MADLRPQHNEAAVGANHPTKTDVINRAYNVEHDEDGTHKDINADSVTSAGAVSGTSGTFTSGLDISGASSGQLVFPATQNASADANTLDDYEEGYHEVTITPETSGTVTVDSNYNTFAYTKIGRVVHIQGEIRLSSVSSPVGDLLISVPFTVADLTEKAGIAVGSCGSYLLDFNASYILCETFEGASYFRLIEIIDNSTRDYVEGADLGGAERFTCQITYFTT